MNTQTEIPDYELAAQELAAECAHLNLTATWKFIPFSLSRNKDEKQPNFNWRFTLLKSGREIMTGDYSSGIAHSPNYRAAVKNHYDAKHKENAINAIECEKGVTAGYRVDWFNAMATKTPILTPSIVDLVSSCARDADVLDHSGFEDWADNFGYDVDSRKAEKIYQLCVDHALKLKAALGTEALARLQELAGRM